MHASVHIHVLLIVNRLVRSSAGMQQLTTTTATITNMQMNTKPITATTTTASRSRNVHITLRYVVTYQRIQYAA